MKKVLIILLTLYFHLGQAQLNESDTEKFQIRSSLSGNFQKGNVDILTLRSRLEFTAMPIKDWIFKSQNSSLYQEFSRKKADNDIFSRNYLYFKPHRRIYPFAIGYVSSNFRRKIDHRYFVGAGLTYQIVNTQNHVLKLSACSVYEDTNYNSIDYNLDQYDLSERISLWRGTAYLGGWSYVLGKKIRIYYDAFYQPAFKDKDNYRTQAEIGLDFPIWNGLSFNALYTVTHENVVPEKVKQDDKILTFGFAYNFKTKKK